jgi:hypothetical protein
MAKIVTQFYTHFYNSRVGKIALVTMDNGEDYKKPTTLANTTSLLRVPILLRFHLLTPLSREKPLVNLAMQPSSA